jgi:hypothetical protein
MTGPDLAAGVPAFVRRLVIPCLLLVLFHAALPQGKAAPPANDGPRFNGRDLAGWQVVDKHFYAQHGRVEWRDGAAVLDAGKPGTAIVWKGAVPRQNYELRCEAKRIDGDDFFCGLTFPIDNSHCTLILGGWGGGTTGLSNINDDSAVENETTDYIPFENGRWYRIRLRVEPKRIQAWVDDKRIVDVDATDKRFSVWWEQEPVRPLGIATWNTRAAIRNLEVTRFPEPPSRPAATLTVPAVPAVPAVLTVPAVPADPTAPAKQAPATSAPATSAPARPEPTVQPHATAADIEFFEQRIRPVLVERCHGCHSAQVAAPKAGLRLDSRAAILRGGESGPAVELDKPAASLLLEAIRYSGTISAMPPDGKLPATVIADFERWISRGTVYPGGGAGPAGPAAPGTPAGSATDAVDHAAPRPVDIAAGRRFWSFQPLATRSPPAVRQQQAAETSPPARAAAAPAPSAAAPAPSAAADTAPEAASSPAAGPHTSARNRIDPFVLAELPAQGLTPAPEAAPRTLLRRLSFDLRGLPPAPDELEELTARHEPDGYERWLDRYLASPSYGERWGRHWLDVARYAEDHPTSEATCVAPRFPFRYRDWVIRAWNADLPYHEQVRRQLAADLLEVRTTAPDQLAALGFLGLSPVYHKEPKLAAEVIATIVADEWDERLDTVTRGFLGLTVACARCHDHKFDPVRTEDYYALAGVMASTQPVEWPLDAAPREAAEALTEVQRQIVDTQLRLDYAKKHRDTAQRAGQDIASHEAAVATVDAELKRLKAVELYKGPIANAVRDASLWLNGNDPAWTYLDFHAGRPRDLPVFVRGNANRHGPIVPRRFLEVLAPAAGAPPFPGNTSGRRELAEAIVSQAGPLAARVIVNRVWAWHFGEGLVRTTSNFGQLGERPTHPDLLEDLAARFVSHGWSLKWLHREILASRTWRQAAVIGTSDPDNRWLAGMPRRRLEPESWRDSVLAVSDQLDHAQFGPSGKLDDPAFRRRTIYGTVSRQKPASLFKLFDFPDAKQHSERRIPTTTPLQHLYLLNSDFMHEAAARLASQCLKSTMDSAAPAQAGDQPAQAGDQSAQAGDQPDPRGPRANDRVDWLFLRVLQRTPTAAERTEALALVAAGAIELTGPAASQAGVNPPAASQAGVSPPAEIKPTAEAARWALLAHALLATTEFLYVD